jgi:hypothetical protein
MFHTIQIATKNQGGLIILYDDDHEDDDVYLKNNTTRMSQNLILQKNADQPKA